MRVGDGGNGDSSGKDGCTRSTIGWMMSAKDSQESVVVWMSGKHVACSPSFLLFP